MSIILNEKEWAENAIANRELGPKPTETLIRVAKYYHQIEGYSKAEVAKKLDEFILQCDPDAVLVKWSSVVSRVARSADKYSIIQLDGVDITEAELEAIGKLESVQFKRLAFTLLCVAKYWDAAQPQNNGWTNIDDREIMNLANINTSTQRQSLMFYEMKKRGLIRFGRRVDSLNIQVCFIERQSPVKIHITDFRNLGNQYMQYIGEPYFQCTQCGLTVRKKTNSQKYCTSCASEIYVKQSVESIMRRRGLTRDCEKAQIV